MESKSEKSELVYALIQFGRLVGVYKKLEDAQQVQKVSLEKGWCCDLIISPVK